MTTTSSRIGEDGSHYYVGLQWIVFDRIMVVDPFSQSRWKKLICLYSIKIIYIIKLSFMAEFSSNNCFLFFLPKSQFH
jgi:hypothetical protein